MKSYHDYHLTGYEIDGELREVRMHLAWQYPNEPTPRPPETVVFEGVEDYFFEHDLGVNIVYSVEEVPLLAHLEEWASKFQTSAKWGWPRFWKGDVKNTMEHLSSRGAKCFELFSSYGLTGWVVANGARAFTSAA